MSTYDGSIDVAAILVNDSGENILVYTPGANGTVDSDCLDAVRGSFPGGGNQAGAEGAYVLTGGESTHACGLETFDAGPAFDPSRGDTVVGAQSGMPKPKEVEELMNEQG
ncbi:MAG: hypothetical protein ACLFPV_07240 [Spirochaetaceae bacterium]